MLGSAALERWAPPLALAAGLSALIAFGMLGVARFGLWAMDFRVFHAAGRTWLAGESPYDRAALDEHFPREEQYLPAFASPPAAAPLYMGLALMSEAAAMRLLDILGLVAVGLLGWIAARMAREPIVPGLAPASPRVFLYFPALFAFSTFTIQTVWLGQVSLITATTLQAVWYCDRKQRPVAGGICLALASIKPQIMMLTLLWFLLEKRWRMILISGLAVGLLMAYPLARGGPIAEMRAWLAAVKDYKTHDPNLLGACWVIGLPSLLAAAGGPSLDLTVPVVVLTVILWWQRRRVCADDVPALLNLGTLGLIYGHDLDCVYLAPLAVSLTLHLRGRPIAGWIAAALVVLFFIPSRFVCQFGVPLLSQWRSAICLVFLGWVLWLSVRHAAAASALQAPRPTRAA
jgi:glycosyl transferase family 87